MDYQLERIKKQNWCGIEQYATTSLRLGPSLSRTTGEVFTGLTKDEEAYFEENLQLPKGTLSSRSEYWTDFQIPIDSTITILRPDESAEHELWLKLLQNDILVANGMEQLRQKSDAMFILSSPEEKSKSANKDRKPKTQAIKIFSGLDPNDMRELLIMFGIKSDDMDNDVIEDRLYSIMEADFSRFVRIASDPNLKMKSLITRAVNYGIIKRSSSGDNAEFTFEDQILGAGLGEVVDFMKVKEHTSVYLAIKKAIVDKLKEEQL